MKEMEEIIITEATERKLGLKANFDNTGVVLTLFGSKSDERDSIYIEKEEFEQIKKIELID